MDNKDTKTNKLAIGGIFVIVLFLIVFLLNQKSNENQISQKTQKILSQETSVENMKDETKEKDNLKIEDIVIGTGAEAKSGKKISVHYKGMLKNGTKFDSSYDRGKPFVFNLGAGEVIAGWDQGIVGMKVGGKRKLTIPPSLAYGNRDLGTIPPNSTLIFEVELLEVKD